MKQNLEIIKEICFRYDIPHEVISFSEANIEQHEVVAIRRDNAICYLNSDYFGNFPTDSKFGTQIAHSKQITKYLINLQGFITPRSINYKKSSSTPIVQFIEESGIAYPVVVKPSSGRHGNKISFPGSAEELQQTLSAIASTADIRNWIIEEYVTGPEYRVFVLFGRPIFTYQKTGGDFKAANIRSGGVYSDFTTDIPPFLTDYCAKLHQSIGLSVMGIDLKTKRHSLGESTARDLTILEINSNPGMSVVEAEKGIDFIYHNIMKPVLDKYFSSL